MPRKENTIPWPGPEVPHRPGWIRPSDLREIDQKSVLATQKCIKKMPTSTHGHPYAQNRIHFATAFRRVRNVILSK